MLQLNITYFHTTINNNQNITNLKMIIEKFLIHLNLTWKIHLLKILLKNKGQKENKQKIMCIILNNSIIRYNKLYNKNKTKPNI